MPLAVLANHHWNGEASLAGIAGGSGGATGTVIGFAAAAGVSQGQGAAQGTLTRLLDVAGLSFGSGQTLGCDVRGTVEVAGIVKIGNLSQDDVTGAVLEAKVEGDLSLKQAIRLLLAVNAGNAAGLDGSAIDYKSLDGATTRVAGTITAGNRTITTRDGS
jgi:hypothetical protein